MNAKCYQIINLISLLTIIVANVENHEISSEYKEHLTKHKDGFIIDIPKVNRYYDFRLICSCGSCSSVKFSFKNHINNSTSENVKDICLILLIFFIKIRLLFQSNGSKVILQNIKLTQNYTGNYTCIGKLKSGEIKTVEKYIYFQPSKSIKK